jgi:hypothetical protein
MLSASSGHLGDLTPDRRLHALGIILPPAAAAVGDYAPTAVIGNLLMTSGQLPWVAGDPKFKGKIGVDLTSSRDIRRFASAPSMRSLSLARRLAVWIGSSRSFVWKARSIARRVLPISRPRSMALRT